MPSISLSPDNRLGYVTSINFGSSSPSLGGTLDISNFPNLVGVTGANNGVTSVSSLRRNPLLQKIRLEDNNISSAADIETIITDIDRNRGFITSSLDKTIDISLSGTSMGTPNRTTRVSKVNAHVAALDGFNFNVSYSVNGETEQIWSGLGLNGLFSNASNWSNTLAPLPYDALYFSGTTGLAMTNDTSIAYINGLTFNNTSGSYTLSGNSLSLTYNGIHNYSSNTQTISATIDFPIGYEKVINCSPGNIMLSNITNDASSMILNKTGSGTLTLSTATAYTGTLALNSGGLALNNINSLQNSTLTLNSGTLSFGVSGTNAYAIGGLSGSAPLNIGGNSIIVGSNGVTSTFSGNLSGTGSLTKTGTGTFTLSGNNSYSGSTVINNGRLIAASSTAITSSSSFSLSGASTLSLSGGFSVANKPLTIDTSGPSSAIFESIARDNTWSGTVTATGTNLFPVTIRNAAELSTFTLSGNIATLSNGCIVTSSLSSSNINFSGVYNGGPIVKRGFGNLTLGSSNTYDARTEIQEGSLTISSINNVGSGNGASSLGTASITANGIIGLGNPTGSSIGTLTYTGGEASTDRQICLYGRSGGGAAINANGTAGTILNFTSNLGFANSLNSTTRDLSLRGTGIGEFSGIIGDEDAASGKRTSLSKTNAGTWWLSNTNSYTGSTTITNGTLQLRPSASINSTSGIIMGGLVGGTYLSKLVYTSTTPLTAPITMNVVSILSGDGTINSNITINHLQIINGDQANRLILGIALIDPLGTSGTFTRNDSAILNLRGTISSTLSGLDYPTTLSNNGILGPWALYGVGTSTRYAAVNTVHNVYGLDGTTITNGSGVVDTTGTSNYSITTNSSTFAANASVNTLRFNGGSGTIAGALKANGLLNVGTGTVTLSGNITNGSNSELVVIPANNNFTISGVLSNNSPSNTCKLVVGQQTNSAVLGLTLSNGANSYSGGTVIINGRVIITASGALGSGPVTMMRGGAPSSTLAASTEGGWGGALLLQNNITVSNNITLAGQGYNGYGGALQSNMGNNIYAGAITIADSVTRISVSTGATLSITGGINLVTATAYSNLFNHSGGDIRLDCNITSVGTTTFNILGGGTAYLITNRANVWSSVGLSLGSGTGTAYGRVDLNGYNQTATSLIATGSDPTQNIITNRSATLATLTINNSNNFTASNSLTGNLALTKTGTGTATLSGTNTYSGVTDIQDGALVVAQSIATATFRDTSLSVSFSSVPTVGSTYRFFPGSTAQSYTSIILTGAGTRTATYNSTNSTLTINS
jgi:fibronectin-binding autotransporter adhesin